VFHLGGDGLTSPEPVLPTSFRNADGICTVRRAIPRALGGAPFVGVVGIGGYVVALLNVGK